MSAAGGRGGHHHQQMDEEESATDCEYDSVSSPGGSTCSGPIYIRHTGFGGPESAAAVRRQQQRPLSQRSDGTPSPGRASPPPEPPQLHMMQHRELLSRHRTLHLPDALKAAEKAVTATISCGGSGSEAKKKKKKAAGLLLCPDYAEAAVKKEIRGVQVAAGKAAAAAPSRLLAAVSRPKHKKGEVVRNKEGGGEGGLVNNSFFCCFIVTGNRKWVKVLQVSGQRLCFAPNQSSINSLAKVIYQGMLLKM